MSKFIVTIPDNIMQGPTIRPYDENEQKDHISDELRDELHEELYEQIKNEIIADIQSGFEERQEEIVQDIDKALDLLQGLEAQARDAKEAIEEAQNTNDRYLDAGDFV